MRPVHVRVYAAMHLNASCADKNPHDPPVLRGGDLLLHFKAHVPQGVVPSFGFMLEQLNGVGITSVAMHTE